MVVSESNERGSLTNGWDWRDYLFEQSRSPRILVSRLTAPVLHFSTNYRPDRRRIQFSNKPAFPCEVMFSCRTRFTANPLDTAHCEATSLASRRRFSAALKDERELYRASPPEISQKRA